MDEYGGVAGLITIEDVLEQIVGDIEDEYDASEEGEIVEHGDRRYSVSALVPIDHFNEHFGTHFSDEQFDTVGGLVGHQLGRIPRVGEQVVLEDYAFRIVRADRRRVQLLEVRPIQRPDDAGDDASPAD